MGEYKQPSQPMWDSEDQSQPLWQPQRSNESGSSNLFEEHYDDPNDPYAAYKRKKKAKKQDDSNSSKKPKPKSKLEESAADLFGIPQSQLEQLIGSAHSSKETKADDIAKAATTEPITPEADRDQTKSSDKTSEPDHNIPGLPKQGGTALPKDKKAQFERKVGDLSDVQVHKAPKHARALKADAFTVGRHVYMGDNATDDTLSHELGHFNKADKETRKGRRKAPDDSWVTKQAELKKQQAAARAAEKERKRNVLPMQKQRRIKLKHWLSQM
jgi:Domain of unknown function (DUF4157)